MPAKVVIQHRRDTAANWAGVILAQGEIGYQTDGADAGNFKIGNGTSAWGALPFVRTSAETITASTGLTKVGSDIRASFGTTTGTVLEGSHAGVTTGVHGVTGAVVGTTDIQDLSNKTFINFREKFNVVASGATGPLDINTSTAAAWFYSQDATANFTFNFRSSGSETLNSILPVGSAVTVSVFIKNGATPRHPTAFSIDGTPVTPIWQVSAAPIAGDANSVNVYTFTILKTAPTPTYTVFASQSRFDNN